MCIVLYKLKYSIQDLVEVVNMNVNNRRVDKKDLTFFQWLSIYELMTKKEFKELPEYKQENYRKEFEMWQNGVSQYN